MEDKEKIQELSYRLDQLIRQQKVFQDEIQRIHDEVRKLKAPAAEPVRREEQEKRVPNVVTPPAQPPVQLAPQVQQSGIAPRSKTPWEEFIGANLLNKVGIAVLVLGVAFGAKYSIDHDLINPLTRIILGYLAGSALLGIAFRLRENHTAFSAVLLSGGMATLYFITFAAYSFYQLIPQVPAFVLMVAFTGFTVLSAVRYNLQVIGIIGLAGAYAVPLLLSDGSGRVVILFSYIAIINAGILFLAFRKNWKQLYYTAFILTWLTFALWFSFSFYDEKPVAISLIFSTIYFLIFYTMFLAYKLVRKEAFGRWDVVCMLFNSFVFFGYGYLAVDSIGDGEKYLGLFTVLTALLHFIAVLIIYKRQEQFGDVFYFVAGMVLVFLTIAVPVQLEGNWVTVVWAAEAALLFWIGRAKSFPAYEKLSYPLMALALVSVLHDWSNEYPVFYYYAHEELEGYRIFLNVQFLTSMLVGAAFIAITLMHRMYASTSPFKEDSPVPQLLNVAVPILAAFVIYTGFFKEIEAFWNHEYSASRIVLRSSDGVEYNQYDESIRSLKVIWLLIFSAIFGYALYLINLRWRNNISLIGSLSYNAIVVFVFMTSGLIYLSALRVSYLDQDLASYYSRGFGHIIMRYVALIAVLPLLFVNFRLVSENLFNGTIRKIEALYSHLVIVVILSSELVHWLEMARVENSFKLSLSILWGAYALFMIVFGLSRDEKHIRLGGMVLFAVTLLKLFAYDMEDMSTILKTIVMIILGALLLIASFIYNKYKRSAGNEAQ